MSDDDDICGAKCGDGTPCQHPADDCPVSSHSNPEPDNAQGRPSKYNKTRAKEACEMAKHGASVAGCARAAGVDDETLSRWLGKHDVFRETFMRARAEGEKKRLQGDSQQDRFILARSFGYEETRHQDVTSDGDRVESPVMILPDNGKRESDGSD